MYAGLITPESAQKEAEELSMGKGVAACTWVVDPESSERLMEVEELCFPHLPRHSLNRKTV
ncbi:uncharacterized protein B0T23DRAFT_391391 [Neurospora hispaniola]|uniref:Uncharacterized protein n=1 Tax=Neurospora hispaniola TaxID=588809 RepID=A0AAJ0HXL9_9PEZI|nr:hypothetical protein B0T23DRAFT_391391 [Neurospora hispaniola]